MRSCRALLQKLANLSFFLLVQKLNLMTVREHAPEEFKRVDILGGQLFFLCVNRTL